MNMQTPDDYEALLKQLLSNPPDEPSTLNPDDKAFLKMCIRSVRRGKPSVLIWQGDADGALQFMLSGTEFGDALKMIGRVIAARSNGLFCRS